MCDDMVDDLPNEILEPNTQLLRSFRVTVAYHGARYNGWQRQLNHPTVQAAVEDAICKLLEIPFIRVLGSSRTDTGVHALGQSFVFRTTHWPAQADALPLALNTKLPPDIVVREAVEVANDFYPLRSNRGKRYRYHVYCGRKNDPINAATQWWIRQRMALEPMQLAAEYIVGEHDFFSFQSAGSPRENTVRDVRDLTITQRPQMDGVLYTLEIEANGFLYNMVRNIVGTLVRVGCKQQPPSWIKTVLASRDRSIAGATAPAQGLFLVEVYYQD